MAEDHGATEAGQLLKAWTRGHRDRVVKERTLQRVSSWTVQNEMRGKSLTVGHAGCSEDEKVHSERDKGAQVPQWKSKESVC